MGSTKEDQTARRRATQDVIAANRPFFEERMRHYYAEAGLGEWSPRLSPEERAAQKAAEKKAAVVARLRAEAAKVGIGILLVEDPDIQEKVDSAADGTFKGVTLDWRGDENGFADEQDERLAARDQATATE